MPSLFLITTSLACSNKSPLSSFFRLLHSKYFTSFSLNCMSTPILRKKSRIADTTISHHLGVSSFSACSAKYSSIAIDTLLAYLRMAISAISLLTSNGSFSKRSIMMASNSDSFFVPNKLRKPLWPTISWRTLAIASSTESALGI